MSNSKHFRLYVKVPGERQFKPMDWSTGSQVGNLIRASIFTAQEVEQLKAVDLAQRELVHLTFEFRPVDW
tara:strand:- start:1169 stop:1378 length:210 start_codon:yes stop_codon:yes gene_type:complete